jgi:hypothetical protein
MKTKLILVLLISSLFFLSDCDFGVGNEFDFDLGNFWGYLDNGYPDSLSAYPTNYSLDNQAIKSSSIFIEAETIVLNENSSASLYFFAVADTSVILNRIVGRLGKLAFINGKYTSKNIDYTIVHISNDNCLQDSSIQPNPVSFEMEKDQEYHFCITMDQLERDRHYYLKGHFYYYIPSVEFPEFERCEFLYEFDY